MSNNNQIGFGRKTTIVFNNNASIEKGVEIRMCKGVPIRIIKKTDAQSQIALGGQSHRANEIVSKNKPPVTQVTKSVNFGPLKPIPIRDGPPPLKNLPLKSPTPIQTGGAVQQKELNLSDLKLKKLIKDIELNTGKKVKII